MRKKNDKVGFEDVCRSLSRPSLGPSVSPSHLRGLRRRDRLGAAIHEREPPRQLKRKRFNERPDLELCLCSPTVRSAHRIDISFERTLFLTLNERQRGEQPGRAGLDTRRFAASQSEREPEHGRAEAER